MGSKIAFLIQAARRNRAAQRTIALVPALGLVSVLLASCGSQAAPPTPVVIVITVVTIATPEPAMTPTATLAIGPTSLVAGTTTATPVATPINTPNPPANTAAPTRRPLPTRTPPVITIVPNGSPTPFIPTATMVPPPVITEWRGEYFNNLGLIGDPVVVRNDSDINFDWLTGSPDPRINLDLWSARWTRSLLFETGTYRFALNVDDGTRLFIDGVLVLDDWRDGARELSTDVTLGRGNHNVRVEYYERGGRAAIQLRITQAPAASPTPFPTWTRVPSTATPPPIATATFTPIPIASATAPATVLPTQPPPPPPSQTPTIIPDFTRTPIPPTPTSVPATPTARPTATSTAAPTLTAIPEATRTPVPTASATTIPPTAVPPTATPNPPTAINSPPAATPTIIPDATETAAPPAETATPIPADTATATATPEMTATPVAKRPTPTPTAAVISPTVVATLRDGELVISGTRWQGRVTIASSAAADGSDPTPLGTATANRRGAFAFATTLDEPIPDPLYIVVQDRRSRLVVQVIPAEPQPAEDNTTPTPIP